MLLLFLLLLPFSVSAADQETYSSGHFYYHAYPGYVSISGYLGTETEVEIPSSLAGKPVSEIEDHAFDGCSSVKQITIPDTVTKIGEDAFTGAEALEKIISHAKDVPIVAEDKVKIETESGKSKELETEAESGKTSENQHPAETDTMPDAQEETSRVNLSGIEQTGLGDGGYEESGSEEKKHVKERAQAEASVQAEKSVQTEESVQTEKSIQTDESAQMKESIQMEKAVQKEESIQTEKAVQTEQNRKEQRSENQESEAETDHADGWIFAIISIAAVCTGFILHRRKKDR